MTERQFNPKLKSFLFSLPILIAIIVIAVKLRPEQHVKVNIQALGTTIWVHAYGTDTDELHKAIGQAEQRIRQVHNDWSPTARVDGMGALAKANLLLEQGQPATLPAHMLPIIDKARELTKASDGYFDPGVGRLITLWGLARVDEDKTDAERTLPNFARVGALAGKDSLLNTKTSGDGVVPQSPMTLDFGAYVKGTAVDHAIEALREAGITRALVNAGGDLKVIGHSKDVEAGWPVSIADPHQLGKLFAKFIALDGEAVFTSGNYLREMVVNGVRYHHLLNPKTGFPAKGLSSVTVVHTESAFADGAATALFAAGDNWQRVAKQLRLDKFVVIDEQRNVFVSEAMAARLTPIPGVEPKSVVVLP